jgi:hypothetical protein
MKFGDLELVDEQYNKKIKPEHNYITYYNFDQFTSFNHPNILDIIYQNIYSI